MSDLEPSAFLQHARDLLRQAGLRCTSARLAVLQQMLQATRPLSHADLADLLAPRGFDRTTIYRNLVELTDAGLLTRFELGDHVWRFELKTEEPAGTVMHPHFLCVDCGQISCLPGVTVNISAQDATSSSTVGNVTEILLKGHCSRCQ